jgi:redox-sensitive bicupin YhaK (pirin superfamily)
MDAAVAPQRCAPATCTAEVTESGESHVGAFRVRRALLRRERRTVGSWCFVDHMGPAKINDDRGLDVATHLRIGIQTVTWLLEGEALHRDRGADESYQRSLVRY